MVLGIHPGLVSGSPGLGLMGPAVLVSRAPRDWSQGPLGPGHRGPSMGPRKGASTAVGSPLAESWQRNCAVTELLVRFSYHFTAAGGLGTSDVTIVLSQTDTFGYRMVLPYVLKALELTKARERASSRLAAQHCNGRPGRAPRAGGRECRGLCRDTTPYPPKHWAAQTQRITLKQNARTCMLTHHCQANNINAAVSFLREPCGWSSVTR